MIDEQDVREAFARMVDAGPPPPSSAAAVATGRRARRRRALLTTGAVAVLAVVATGAALAVVPRPGGGPPAAPSSVRMAPQSPLTAEEIGRLLPGCARVADVDPLTLVLVNAESFGDPEDDTGVALLTGPAGSIFCDYRRPTGDYAVTAVTPSTRSGPVAIDLAQSRSRSDDGYPLDPMAGGYDVVLGRVPAGATRVGIRIGDRTQSHDRSVLYNGTFLFLLSWDPNRSAADSWTATVQAYDAQGRLLGRATARR